MTNDQKNQFIRLACALSPENLSCDGELPRHQVREREIHLRNQWKTMECAVGRKVSECEVEDWLREPVARNLLVKGQP